MSLILWVLWAILAASHLGCDDADGGSDDGYRVELTGEGIEDADRLVLTVKREPPAGSDAPRGVISRAIALNGGQLIESALVLPGALIPPGEGPLYLHAVAQLEGDPVGVADAPIGDGLTGRFEVRVVVYKAACDLDGDTHRDCFNVREKCCDDVASDSNTRDAIRDCVDDPSKVEPPARPDGKRRDASAAHPFAPTESGTDYPTCDNDVDDDCTGGDFACDRQTDEDEDGHAIHEDCDDDDPAIHRGAYDQPGDDIDQDCDGADGQGTDEDDDGWFGDDPDPARRDCDDDDAGRFPGGAEIPCDGVDQDCDEMDPCPDMTDLDADGVPTPQDCDDYDAGTFPGAPERCGDGLDQDCAGGDLACAEGDLDRDGFTGGDDCDEMDAATHAGAPEKCGDGVDQDCAGGDLACDGRDGDGDGYLPPADCDDAAPEVHPNAPELCNLDDDDCDGRLDEGQPLRLAPDEEPRPPTCGQEGGTCFIGRQVCTREDGRATIVCLGQLPTTEQCDGLDNDCDGMSDEPDVEGGRLEDEGQQPCGPEREMGLCRRGTLFCDGGALSRCEGAVFPIDEQCNGMDDDCDGIPDNDQGGGMLVRACFAGTEEQRNQGQCRDGIQECDDGEFGACEGLIGPEEESCNTQDDDCDGTVDESVAAACYTFIPPETLGTGVCRGGTRLCVDGVFGECQGEVGPSPELCNDLDDDCDGRVDQFPAEACFDADMALIGIGRCRAGQHACINGEFGPCQGQVLPGAEACDLEDDDCDGEIDEDFDLLTDADHCGQCNRACAEGEVCCSGLCRRLDTAQNCGACGESCDRQADRCEISAEGARCRCGDGDACPGDQRCIDGACRCVDHDDCGDDELCCDGACEPARARAGGAGEPAQCAACDDGGCDPEVADNCSERECQCGRGGACGAGTVCGESAGGLIQCLGCTLDSQCPANQLCCNRACAPTDPGVQCEACGERCSQTAADTCLEVGRNNDPPLRCVCGEEGAPCAGGTPYCIGGSCEECRDDRDCPAGRTRCVDHVCRECNPADHAPCAANQLCCDFRCRATGSAPGEQCETCGEACDQLSTNRCNARDCDCGENEACSGNQPVCDDARGACVQCRNDGDCVGHPNGGQCVANFCRVCDPMGHDGCGANQLCCNRMGTPRCEATGFRQGDQCEACDVACDVVNSNVCTNRTCGCGNNADCSGNTPVCEDASGRCVECLVDGHCNGRPGRSQCVSNVCQPCDPGDHQGCGGDQLCCNFQCTNTGGGAGAQCESCGRACGSDADVCRSRDCQCGATGADCPDNEPFCVGGQCDTCTMDAHCPNDRVCCNGNCVPTGAEPPSPCTTCGAACNPATSNQCTARACRCGNNPACGANLVCRDAENRCVQCNADGDCAGRPGLPQCVGETCRACDPTGHVECGEGTASPICDAATFQCRQCNNSDECRDRPGSSDQCVSNRCRVCNPMTHAGCGGATPTCDAATFTCRECEADNECAGGGQCLGNGRCAGCDPDDDLPCPDAQPICDPNNTMCRTCNNAGECLAKPGNNDQCVLGLCLRCDPQSHAGCAANELCCGGACVATGPGANQSCTGCNQACAVDATNVCTNRVCRCGNNAACSGQRAFCNDVNGTCVNCRDDGDCAVGRPECVATNCEVCDPANDAGCTANSNRPNCAGTPPACVACAGDGDCTNNPSGGQCLPDGTCRACDPADHTGCAEAGNLPICGANGACRVCMNDGECNTRPGDRNQCVAGLCRSCDTGDPTTCDRASGTPICANSGNNSVCRACMGDNECVGNPNGGQCVGGFCKLCDPNDDAGCASAGATPICQANNTCAACASDEQCEESPNNGDQCLGNGTCVVCDSADHDGCDESGATPICQANNTCAVCANTPECVARPGTRDLCIAGTCHACNQTTGAGCGAQVCNADEQCVNCVNDGQCATHQNGAACFMGACSECNDHADCAGEICTAGACIPCDDNQDCIDAGLGNNCNNGTCQ